jgi:hypothetical protein
MSLVCDEIWLNVFKYLDCSADELVTLSATCKRFRRIAKDRQLQVRRLLKLPTHASRDRDAVPLSMLVVGDAKVGKTSFIARFVNDGVNDKQGFVSLL